MEYVDEPSVKDAKENSDSAAQLQPCSGSSTPRQHMDEPSTSKDNASASKVEGAEGSSAAMDLRTKKHGRATVSTVERQLQNLGVENPTFQEEPSQSGQRLSKLRQKRRVISGTRGTPLYTSQGVLIASNIDACDCMEVACPVPLPVSQISQGVLIASNIDACDCMEVACPVPLPVSQMRAFRVWRRLSLQPYFRVRNATSDRLQRSPPQPPA